MKQYNKFFSIIQNELLLSSTISELNLFLLSKEIYLVFLWYILCFTFADQLSVNIEMKVNALFPLLRN